MYLTGTEGEVLSASTDNSTYLRFRNDPLGGVSQAEVYAARAPISVSVNGTALPSGNWSYNSGEHVITLKGLPAQCWCSLGEPDHTKAATTTLIRAVLRPGLREPAKAGGSLAR